eukprot:TRINITY_DN68058_c0_g1_i1.p1 TRINITY_DN68058_c0_g1~~TRINITY_DN68058_c0_g1_i1.p1  ORF type:complete len:560 (-),score=106.41 TRINITY_DN68058_c0_g1_i1:49-1686(-)
MSGQQLSPVLVPLSALLNRLLRTSRLLAHLPRLLLAVLRSKLCGDGNAALVLGWIFSVSSGKGTPRAAPTLPQLAEGHVRLFSWKLSYFSGKIRGYLRYKARQNKGMSLEEFTASPDVVAGILVPSTGSSAVPQLQLPDGRIIQDSKDIVEAVEAMYPEGPALPPLECPQQRLTCLIIELLADEWLLVPAFHWRWAYSGDGSSAQAMPTFMGGVTPLPSHRRHNEEQWGAFLRPNGSLEERCSAGRFLIDNVFLTPVGLKEGMRSLGVTEETVAAWEASCRNILQILNTHFTQHSFVLGGRPSTADFALLGPLYAHLYCDPVPGDMMRNEFPHVADWCTRLHCLGGECQGVRRETPDWLPEDKVPETCLPLLQVFFDEMWPVLRSSCDVLRRHLRSPWCAFWSVFPGRLSLPDKSFNPETHDQEGFGPLSHAFQLPFDRLGQAGVVAARRMVVPHQIWMLQRLETTLRIVNPEVVGQFLACFRRGSELQLASLCSVLAGCRLIKKNGKLFPCEAPNSYAWGRLLPLIVAVLVLGERVRRKRSRRR